VCDVDNGSPSFPKRGYDLKDGVAGLWIDAGRRLIQENQRWVMHQSHSQVDPPFHATGEAPDAILGAIGQPDELQQLRNAGLTLPSVHTIERSEKIQILAGAELVVNAEGLRRQPNPGSSVIVGRGTAINADLARIGGQQPHDHREGGRFPCTIGSQEPKDLSAMDIQG
jgi:hypothetical protein